jgi:cyclase
MRYPRIIPVLLLDRDRRLVKTVGFGKRTYIGDPFNVLRLFNEKEVTEIIVLDIDATVDNREPDLGFVAELASECFVPLSYGGGLHTIELCEKIVSSGVEKLVIGTKAQDTAFVGAVSKSLGAQAVIGCVDYRGCGPTAQVYCRSGQLHVKVSIEETVETLASAGCGEVILQSIDLDGMRCGFDLSTISWMGQSLAVPLIALGGAGDADHLAHGLRAGASAVASGSAFSFIGRLRAVLISYPEPTWIETLALDLSEVEAR